MSLMRSVLCTINSFYACVSSSLFFQGNPVTERRAHPDMAFIVAAPPDLLELDRGDSSGAVPPPPEPRPPAPPAPMPLAEPVSSEKMCTVPRSLQHATNVLCWLKQMEVMSARSIPRRSSCAFFFALLLLLLLFIVWVGVERKGVGRDRERDRGS